MINNSASESRTIEIAQALASTLNGGEVLALTGDLGAGKTVFAKGLAKKLGVSPTVISPTFNLVKIYQIAEPKSAIKEFCHVDLYRLNSSAEALDLGISDYFGKKDVVCLVEWADKFPLIFPKNTIWIEFETLDQNNRKITIKGQQ